MNVESITAQDLLDVAEFIYLALDLDQNVVLINRKGCEILNYSEEEIIGKNWFDNFLPKKVAKKVKSKYLERISSLDKFKTRSINPILTKSGEERIIGWQNTYITDESGKISGVLSSGIDITDFREMQNDLAERAELVFGITRDKTERKESEERIKSSEALYRALFENTGTGVLLTEEDFTISLCNRRLLEISGYTKEEIIGKKIIDFISEEEKENVLDNLSKIEEVKDILIRFETKYIHKEGDTRNFLIFVCQIPETGQRIASFIDITLEKKLETILVESEERLSNLVENVPIAMVTQSEEGRLLVANPEYWKLLGYTNKEEYFTIEPSDHWVNLKDRERLYSLLKKKKLIRDFEAKFVRKDGRVFWGSISAIVHKDFSGDLVSYQSLQDITSKKEMERELRQQLMKYKVEEANLYAVEEEIAYTSLEAFKDLLKLGYPGVVISRTPESNWRKEIDADFEFFKLAEKGKMRIVSPSLEALEQIIEELPNRQVILIDRLDYLIQKNGFEITLFSLYRLMDIAYLANHIILLSIDSSTLQTREKNLLKKELKPIVTKIEGIIPEDLFEVLMFIYQKNVSGDKLIVSDIVHELQISRPTARKRIQNLITEGYITTTVRGRSKVLQITQKGKMIF